MPKINLVIDQGNSSCKLGIFRHGELLSHKVIKGEISIEGIRNFAGELPEISRSLICSVGDVEDGLTGLLNGYFPTWVMDKHMKIPLKVKYTTPDTLGYDRLAAAVAGSRVFPGQDVLVIDAGSCVTFDVVNASGEYLGGAISPGMDMRYKALHAFTERLPLIGKRQGVPVLGHSTAASICSGVQNGMAAEVKGMIAAYRTQFPHIKTILTGGDMDFFEKAIENHSFADRFLVLRGLNDILEYHATSV